MDLNDYKLYALQQAAQRASAPAVAGGNGLDQLLGQQQPMQVTTPNVTEPKPGPIRSFLSNFLYGAGQGMLSKVGLETDAQKEQRQIQQQVAQQNAATGELYRQALAKQAEAKNELVDSSTYNIPGVTGMMTHKEIADAAKQYVSNLGKQKVADTVTAGKQKVAETVTQGKLDVQNVKGTQQAAHDAVAAQVRRDVAAGQLGMAGARLRLAQQVAAAKQNGTYGAPSADRLRRADLANNAQDNINQTIEDIQTDPNLFGQIAGRYTTVRQMLGSDDPKVRTIAIQMHNAALASNGAHGLRAQGAIEGTEDAMLNHFRDNPEVAIEGLKTMNRSLDTFINDANYGKMPNPKGAKPSTAAPSTGAKATHRFNPATGKIEVIQ